MADTIFALATPPGVSGIAVMRLSGDFAYTTALKLSKRTSLTPRFASYTPLYAPDAEHVIDNVLLLYFPAPASFTGEDVIEIHCHGSHAVIQELTEILMSFDNLRYAEPGEFSRRALENGKMDLVQVESLLDLIHADSFNQKQLALETLHGNLSSQFAGLEQLIIELRAYCEALIDFPDDDLPDNLNDNINQRITSLQQHIQALLLSSSNGKRIREGIKVAIIGVPNAGKSSLINMLANKDIAITSEVSGTTRDVIEAHCIIHGQSYIFYDTAGIRETDDTVEKIGVSLARKHAYEADVILCLFDVTKSVESQEKMLLEIVSRETNKVIYAYNKSDLVHEIVSRETILISTKTGDGTKKLIEEIAKRSALQANNSSAIVSHTRHIKLLENALMYLTDALQENDFVLKTEYIALATKEIAGILGKIDIEKVLDTLFSNFCIGK